MFTSTKLTTAGKNLIAYLIANNLPLTLTKIKIGAGETYEFDLEDLVDMKMETLIETISENNGTNYVRGTFTNESLINGFSVREVGIYALNQETDAEILYAYDNAGSGECDYFEAGTGEVILKEVFEIATSFGNVNTINLTINPQYVFITETNLTILKKK